MQWTTVISDGVLAAVSLGGSALLLAAGSPAGAAGMGMVGLAALLGAAKFAGVDAVVPVHTRLVAASGTVGVPLLGAAWVWAAWALPAWGLLVLATGLVVGAVLAGDGPWKTAVGGAAMAGVVAAGVWLGGLAGVAGVLGAVGTVVAGLVIGTEGHALGLPRVDWFHAVLTVSNAALAWGLLAV